MAVLVSGDLGASVIKRGLPGQHRPSVATGRLEVLRFERYGHLRYLQRIADHLLVEPGVIGKADLHLQFRTHVGEPECVAGLGGTRDIPVFATQHVNPPVVELRVVHSVYIGNRGRVRGQHLPQPRRTGYSRPAGGWIVHRDDVHDHGIGLGALLGAIVYPERETREGTAAGIGCRSEPEATIADVGDIDHVVGVHRRPVQFQHADGRQSDDAHARQAVAQVAVAKSKVGGGEDIHLVLVHGDGHVLPDRGGVFRWVGRRLVVIGQRQDLIRRQEDPQTIARHALQRQRLVWRIHAVVDRGERHHAAAGRGPGGDQQGGVRAQGVVRVRRRKLRIHRECHTSRFA